MAATITNMTISAGSTSYTLPVPVQIAPSGNALDAETSGRDNNTGLMHRDFVAAKQKYTITFPSGLDNTQVASIYAIIMNSASYNITAPSIATGAYETINVYTSTMDPEIEKVNTDAGGNWTSWTYKEFSIDAIEM